MARFTSKKYPELTVKFSDGSRVKFTKREVEVDGEAAERLAAFANAHPDYEIEQVEGDAPEKPLTPKQKAVARAEELGLDASGTQADIEARIAAFVEADAENEDDEDPENTDEDDENEDETDEDDDSDSSDDEDSDDA